MLYIPRSGRICHQCNQWKPANELVKRCQNSDIPKVICKNCWRIYQKHYRKAHPDKDSEYRARPEVKEYMRQYRENNRLQLTEQRRAYWKKYNKINRNKIKTYHQSWYRSNRERLLKQGSEWLKNNPNKNKTKYHRRAARKLDLLNAFTDADWQRALNYFDNRCAVCRRPPGLWHTLAMDHWIPISDPSCPGTVPTNIVPLCHGQNGCNNSKSNGTPSKWLADKFGPRKAKQILKRINNYFEWAKIHQH